MQAATSQAKVLEEVHVDVPKKSIEYYSTSDDCKNLRYVAKSAPGDALEMAHLASVGQDPWQDLHVARGNDKLEREQDYQLVHDPGQGWVHPGGHTWGHIRRRTGRCCLHWGEA